ncbi:hypothetical protein [Allochromatium vinosum]|uniref:Uncharacterized protein n=1 Tax=Allochromatium vinosum (strain ATCC 17899 / DSM 180 / NBRC 103801 / NCIMB 10441 / D) TaxID=572477 RepID=D3RW86_ALLVD|nr:hypothetical protein [Allochromatium vinosum]ADC64098.1 hypothetical protein Alvin_3202 [Allochromatium vinosum DSM 180]
MAPTLSRFFSVAARFCGLFVFNMRAKGSVWAWRTEIRPGKTFAVYQSGPLAARIPPYAVKVWLPAGLSSSAARDQLRAAFFHLTW